MRPQTLARRVGVAAAAIVAACAIGIALLHVPFVRTRALAMLIARLADAGVVVRADRLEYNLTALSVSLSGVTVAAAGTTETPFFAAKEVAATLPWAILSGRFTIDRIEVVSPSVTLRRDAA